jgi:transglutaminase-like putative cysteine protease
MSLDLIGRIRGNEQIAMRIEFGGRTNPPGAMRFKAATYDVWEGRSWRRSARSRAVLRDPREGVFRLAPGPPEGTAKILLEPLRTTSLVLPMEALTVELPLAALDLDRGGAVSLRGMPFELTEYTVALGGKEISLAPAPATRDGDGPTRDVEADPSGTDEATIAAALDLSGITPRIAALARDWAGEGDAGERARRIERHLLNELGYTVEFIGRGGSQPIENFLFEARRGHCEYFASSMVMLLRAEGIPARLVTGFLGAEYNAWERAWLVRQSNAHAWVEGYVPGEGWIAFDPTPPLGRPQIEPQSLGRLFRSAYDFMMFRWDRYVISFDFYDQIGLLFNARALWEQLKRELFAATTRTSPPAGEVASPVDGGPAPISPERPRFELWALGVAVLLAAIGLVALLRQRGEWNRTQAYAALVATLRGSGLAVPEWAGPLAVRDLAAERFPAAAPASRRIVQGYLRESFAGDGHHPSEAAAARRDLAEVEAAIRATRAAVKYSRRGNRTEAARRRGNGA